METPNKLLSYLKRERRFLLIVTVLLALNFLVWGSVFGLFDGEKPPPES